MEPGIFITGGCMVRDTYERLKNTYPLTGYVARQSLISAANRPTTILPEASLKSSFQTRAVNGDIASNLIPTVEQVSDRTALFVMDLHVERLGVHLLPDGSFVTRSNEMKHSRVLDAVPGLGGRIHVGTQRHTRIWTYAAQNFARKLEALGVKDRFLVVNAPWATVSTDGSTLPPLFTGRPLEEVSADISALAGILRDLGFTVVDLPPELAVTSPDHKWGPAPYHYAEPAMEWLTEQVDSAMRDQLAGWSEAGRPKTWETAAAHTVELDDSPEEEDTPEADHPAEEGHTVTAGPRRRAWSRWIDQRLNRPRRSPSGPLRPAGTASRGGRRRDRSAD